MDEQLDFAPCGYVSLADDGTILSINTTLLELLEFNIDEVQGNHINFILTKPTKVFYQLYFFPMMSVQETVEEMYLTLQSKSGDSIPVLLNATRNKRNGILVNDCIVLTMKKRHEYEKVVLLAKKEVEEKSRLKKKAISELEQVRSELELKQKELLELNEKLQGWAFTDGLTGLHNRRSYSKLLFENLALFKRNLNPFSLLMIDVDYFKSINDTYGHLAGDQMLIELAAILKSYSGENAISARYGGEEFALILPNTNKENAVQIAERIRISIEASFSEKSPVTISVGIATSKTGDTKKDIQSRADQALYISKNNGRNQVTYA